MKTKNKVVLVSIAIVLLLTAAAAGSVETSSSIDKSILNDTENRTKAFIEAIYSPPPHIFNNATDVEGPQGAHLVPISEDKLRELDKEEELNPKEPYVLALWGGEYYIKKEVK